MITWHLFNLAIFGAISYGVLDFFISRDCDNCSNEIDNLYPEYTKFKNPFR